MDRTSAPDLARLADGDREGTHPASPDTGATDRLADAGGGRTGAAVWIAGQVAWDRDGRLGGEGDHTAQADQRVANVRAVVEAPCGTMDDVVHHNGYVIDRTFRDAVDASRVRALRAPGLPVGAVMVLTGQVVPEFLVEVDTVAVPPR